MTTALTVTLFWLIYSFFLKLNFIFFSKLLKIKFNNLMYLSLALTRAQLTWQVAGVPGWCPCVQASGRRALSHTTTVDIGDRTRFAAMRNVCIVNYASWTPFITLLIVLVTWCFYIYPLISINSDIKCSREFIL